MGGRLRRSKRRLEGRREAARSLVRREARMLGSLQMRVSATPYKRALSQRCLRGGGARLGVWVGGRVAQRDDSRGAARRPVASHVAGRACSALFGCACPRRPTSEGSASSVLRGGGARLGVSVISRVAQRDGSRAVARRPVAYHVVGAHARLSSDAHVRNALLVSAQPVVLCAAAARGCVCRSAAALLKETVREAPRGGP